MRQEFAACDEQTVTNKQLSTLQCTNYELGYWTTPALSCVARLAETHAHYSLLTHPPLSYYMFSLPRLPPHDRGRRLACQLSTAWPGAQFHHRSIRLCSSEAAAHATRCSPAASSSLYHRSLSDPPSPGEVRVPTAHAATPLPLLPQLSLVVDQRHPNRECSRSSQSPSWPRQDTGLNPLFSFCRAHHT